MRRNRMNFLPPLFAIRCCALRSVGRSCLSHTYRTRDLSRMPSSEAASSSAEENLSDSADDGTNPAATLSDVCESNSGDSSGDEFISTVPVTDNWQKSCGTVRERDEYILQKKWHTDLIVTVGRTEEARTDIACHRLYLAKSSHSLACRIYVTDDAHLQERQAKISLLDIEPDTFQLLLDYVYFGELPEDLTSRQLKDLLLAAEIHDFPDSMIDDIEELLEPPGKAKTVTDKKKRGKKRKSSSTSQPPKKKRKSLEYLESGELSQVHWQKGLTSVVERDQKVLKKKQWTDCTIELGCSSPECNNEPTTTYQCHRLILMKTSKVLETILGAEDFATPGNQVIHIHNVSAQNFLLFLRYAYEGQLNLSELWKNEQFWSFMEFAKQFSLPDRLQEQCRAFVYCKLYTNSIWDVLKHAEANQDRLLVETCGKVLFMFPDKCINWLSKLSWDSKDFMLWLVQQNRLAVAELDLFIECVNWAKRSLKAPGVKLTPMDIRTELATILPHIRFRAMSKSEFSQAADYSKIFSKEECVQIRQGDPNNLANLCHPDNSPRETPMIDSLYVFGCHPDDLKLQLRFNIYLAFLYCLKKSDKDLQEFHEVQIPSQMRPAVELGERDPEAEDFYWEDVTVLICCFQRNRKTAEPRATEVLHKQRFTEYVGYDTTITIPLDQTVKAHPTKINMVGIIPHRSGRYPYELEKADRKNPTLYNKFVVVT